MSEERKLTIDDFRFSKIKHYVKTPPVDRNQLIVRIVKTDPVYKSLSVQHHRSYIEHNIPEIPNSCPTICQWWEELKVYRCELLNDGTHPLFSRKPCPDFYEDANINFASALNARFHKFPQRVPLYYLRYNPITESVEHVEVDKMKKHFCRLYEKDIMSDEESKSTFLLLLALCKGRDKKFPVIIRGFENCDSMYEALDLKKIYDDPKKEFVCEYCLVEMLIHYPNLNECLWNRE